MSNYGFGIICNRCGSKATAQDDTNNKDYKKLFPYYYFSFNSAQNEKVKIRCSCGNEVSINQ